MSISLIAQPGSRARASIDAEHGLGAGRFGIRAKLVLSFAVVLVLTALLGLLALSRLRNVSSIAGSVYDDHLLPTKDLAQARAQLGLLNSQTLSAIADQSGRSRSQYVTEVDKDTTQIDSLLANYGQGYILTDQEKQNVAALEADWKQYQTAAHAVLEAAEAGDINGASRMYFDQAGPLYSRTDGDLAKQIAIGDTVAKQLDGAIDTTYARTLQETIGIIVIALLLGGTIAYWVSRSIGRTVAQMTSASLGLARGELDQRIDVRSRDELGLMAQAFRRMITYQSQMAEIADTIARGDLTQDILPQSDHDVLGLAFQRMTNQLRRMAEVADAIARGELTQESPPQSANDVLGLAFQRMIVNLRRIVGELQQGASNLSSASSEILAAVSQQSAGSTEQSAAIAQTTATVDEVKASAEQASQSADQLSHSAQQAIDGASAGVSAVRDATHGVADIRHHVHSIAENILVLSEQGQQIGEIIATVNDLADQSNLLALNAAIEANRAGEQGKGFIVVANEIRALAERSKAATAQIRTILFDIQRATNAAAMATEQGTKGADIGTQLIDKAGDVIDQLSEVIHETADTAQQIAASVRQHSVGMEQIAVAMSSIDQATSQNLAATDNTRQAAQNLAGLAGRLTELTAQYQV